MSSQLTIEQLLIILEDYLTENKIPKNDIRLTSRCNKSDGYVSYVYRVLIDKGRIDLIVKSAPKQKKFRSLLPVRELYGTEIYVYSEIFEIFSGFCRERGKQLQEFVNFPKLIAFSYDDEFNETIVLENIRLKGYEMWDKRFAMNKDHIVLALEEYGRFHAISWAIKKQNRSDYEGIINGLKRIHNDGRNAILNDNFYNWFRPALENTKKLFLDNREILEKLRFIGENLEEIFETVYDYKGPHDVICHLDCWSNNMMFKYKDGNPVDLYLIDFQYTTNTSPANDVAYFFYVSAPPEEYPHHENFLRIYYESFRKTCIQLDSDTTNKIYSYADFVDEWKRFAKFGFLRAILGIPLSLREQEEVVDVKDVADNNHIETDKAFGVDEWSTECKDWIFSLTLHMFENNFL